MPTRWKSWWPTALVKTIDAPEPVDGVVLTEPTKVTGKAERTYDMRRLSYAGTFTNPFKAGAIRSIEWLTAKVTLLRLIRQFERSGAPFGAPFWPKAIAQMGIDIQTPAEEIARIPATGPVVVVANHPHGRWMAW